jgi:hypothetical protein
MDTGLGRGVDQPPEVKERVELYLYFTVGLYGLFDAEL